MQNTYQILAPQELTLVMFGARLTQDQQITMKHISFLDFQITCKFFIFAIIDSNNTYLGQMRNAKYSGLTIMKKKS